MDVQNKINDYNASEEKRIENEDRRIRFEQVRVEAEDGRVKAETARAEAEKNREQHTTEVSQDMVKATEEVRKTNVDVQRQEEVRQTQEGNRERAENTRLTQENTRKEGETARERSENARSTQESIRQTNEQNRQQGEEGRVNAERGRVTAEQTRVQADTKRQQGFTEAVDSCTKAVQSCTAAVEEVKEAEKHHEASEASRVEAEKKRVEGFSASKTACDQATADANKVIERANTFITPSGDPMHYAYETAGAVFNDATGFYELNGIMDIGEEEMALIYETANINGITIFSTNPFGELIRRTNIGKVMQIINIPWCRILPTFLYHYAADGDSLEVYSFGVERIYPKTFDYSFYNLPKLREVRGIIDLTFCESFVGNFGVYHGCPNLVHLKVYGLKSNWNIQTLESLSMECVRYIISNANQEYEITLTLFTPIYEACLTDAEVQKALESHPLLRLAGGGGLVPVELFNNKLV